MKSISLCAAFVMAITTSATAGNFETPAAIALSPDVIDQNIWEGFYAGALVSFAHSEMLTTETGRVDGSGGGYNGVGSEASNLLDHTNFGIFAGKNWQRNNLVFGIDASLSYTDAYSSELGFGSNDTYAVFDSNLEAIVAGRAGFAFKNVLIFGKVGVSALNGSFGALDEGAIGSTIDTTGNKTAFGLNYGAGIEVMIGSGWSARVEYSVSEYSTLASTGISSNSGNSFGWDHDISSESISVGIARHF